MSSELHSVSRHGPSTRWVLLAVALGTLLGLALRLPSLAGIAPAVLNVAELLGDLFIRALKMIVVPLVFFSITAALSRLTTDIRLGRLGLYTGLYYAMTTVIATVIGITLVNLIKPGLDDNGQPHEALRAAIAEKESTYSQSIAAKTASVEKSSGFDVVEQLAKSVVPENWTQVASDNRAMLALVFLSFLVGLATRRTPVDSRTRLVQAFVAGQDLMLTITHWVLSLAPLGVLGLVTTAVAATGGSVFILLGKHFLTVLLGLAIHAGLILPTIVWIFTRISPRRLLQIVSEAMLTAFTTSSSSATIAVSLRSAIEKGGVPPRVASFVIPLGATINMDGTALYECAAVMFIAQVLGFPIDVWSQFTIVLLACLTSVGVAGVPAASLVAVVLIVNSIGIPGAQAAIGFIYAVDRLLDMSRTSVNVMSDACGALVVTRLEERSPKSPA